MASTILPADRVLAASQRAATKQRNASGGNLDALLGMLHLSSAALSVNANATITVTSEEFLLLAESW